MSRRSANGMLRRKLFSIRSNPEFAASPYPSAAARSCLQSNPDSAASSYRNTAARSNNHDFTAAPYPSTAARSSRQSVTTALIDS